MRRRGLAVACAVLSCSSLVVLTGTASAAGSARRAHTSGGGWTQKQELTASDGAPVDTFNAAAASGTTAVIGAPQHEVGTHPDQGAAYVFTDTAGTWTQSQELTATGGAHYDQFGTSVAISGTTALIGSPFHKDGTSDREGAVYVFNDVDGTWTQTQTLTSSDGTSGDYFGASVAMSGTEAVIGALFHGDGAAYVFTESGGTWSEQKELTASDGAPDDQFGCSVAISGATVVVAADAHTVGTNTLQGAAYVFTRSGTTWTQAQELTAADGAASDELGADTGYGSAVAVSGKTVLVGSFAHEVDGNMWQGAAYIFTKKHHGWSQTEELTASDGTAVNGFGNDVALSGTTALIGARWHGSDQQGSTYVFTKSRHGWNQSQELTAANAANGDEFGSSVAISGSTAVIGAMQVDSQQGAAYVFGRA